VQQKFFLTIEIRTVIQHCMYFGW